MVVWRWPSAARRRCARSSFSTGSRDKTDWGPPTPLSRRTKQPPPTATIGAPSLDSHRTPSLVTLARRRCANIALQQDRPQNFHPFGFKFYNTLCIFVRSLVNCDFCGYNFNLLLFSRENEEKQGTKNCDHRKQILDPVLILSTNPSQSHIQHSATVPRGKKIPGFPKAYVLCRFRISTHFFSINIISSFLIFLCML